MPDEEGLIRRAVGGQAAAFEEIVRTHQKGVYGVVLGIVGNPLDADDLTQEAFIRAHHRLSSFRGESSLKTWLTRIAVNGAQDFLRRQRVRRFLPLGRRHEASVAHQGPGAEERLMSRQRQERIAAFIRTLSERERTVFSLRFSGGHTLAEIAELTAASPSTVKTHLYRALAKAREHLGEGRSNEAPERRGDFRAAGRR